MADVTPIRFDGPLLGGDLAAVPAEARAMAALGYDGVFTFEGPHDPFFPLVLAAEHAPGLDLATAIAIAFPRSPMQLANVGHDLQMLSRGRFILGLGSQIRPHIERRFGAVWSRPVARMGEMVQALRAIWRCWNEDVPLDFRGAFYTHTLMPPIFKPPPSPWGPPRVFLAGVGAAMTRMVGEVADGLFVHPLHSPASLDTITMPALAEGARRAGRAVEDVEIACQALVITGYSEEELRSAVEATRMQVAFYASTPQYRVALDVHGWGGLQPELRMLSKAGRWLEMGGLVSDEMLGAFTVWAEPDRIPELLAARYTGRAQRVSIVCHADPHRTHPDAWADVVTRCRSLCR